MLSVNDNVVLSNLGRGLYSFWLWDAPVAGVVAAARGGAYLVDWDTRSGWIHPSYIAPLAEGVCGVVEIRVGGEVLRAKHCMSAAEFESTVADAQRWVDGRPGQGCSVRAARLTGAEAA